MSKILPLSELSKPKAILLDWDNTLADSWPIIHRCLNVTFKKFGQDEWTLDEVISGRGNIHHSMRESFPLLFGDQWKAASETYLGTFVECHLEEIKLLPHALNTIKSLYKLDIFLGIVSNKTGKHLRAELAHLGIDKYFNVIVGATDAAKDKPHKAPLLLALRDSGIEEQDFSKVWMVGDSKTDIEAAWNTGVIPVLFGNAKIHNTSDKPHIYHTKNHIEFAKILKNINKLSLPKHGMT